MTFHGWLGVKHQVSIYLSIYLSICSLTFSSSLNCWLRKVFLFWISALFNCVWDKCWCFVTFSQGALINVQISAESFADVEFWKFAWTFFYEYNYKIIVYFISETDSEVCSLWLNRCVQFLGVADSSPQTSLLTVTKVRCSVSGCCRQFTTDFLAHCD